MLSRTADHLYWMSRYSERAEGLARLVDVHYRMSLLPHSAGTLAGALSASLRALQLDAAYAGRHGTVEPRTVFEFLVTDRDNPASILSCLRAARENARAVRGSLTSELWVTMNSTWLDARAFALRSARSTDTGQFVEWVKERSNLMRGVSIGTMLRDEAFHFTRIGTFLERADNTVRILMAHRRDLEQDASVAPDPYEWTVLLRALSAFEIYRRVYRDVVTPPKVAELLLLRDDMPRSLLRCCKEIHQNLRAVSNDQSRETERRAGGMHAALQFSRMPDVVAGGLPQFLASHLARICDLADRIANDFLVPLAEA